MSQGAKRTTFLLALTSSALLKANLLYKLGAPVVGAYHPCGGVWSGAAESEVSTAGPVKISKTMVPRQGITGA